MNGQGLLITLVGWIVIFIVVIVCLEKFLFSHLDLSKRRAKRMEDKKAIRDIKAAQVSLKTGAWEAAYKKLYDDFHNAHEE